jgi:AAA15 family ATPase/GTPase
MQITKIKVNNFKSLVDFEIDLAKFNCIVGLNGSGKSTFLQFMSLLSQLMKGDIGHWLKTREWDSIDCKSWWSTNTTILFSVEFIDDNSLHGYWSATYDCGSLYCVKEEIVFNGKKLIVDNADVEEVGSYKFSMSNNDSTFETGIIPFQYEGSILSVFKEKKIADALGSIKISFSNIESCDLLTPFFLRKGSSAEKSDSIGLCGENLAAFLWNIGDEKREELLQKLRKLFPQIRKIEVIDNDSFQSAHGMPKNLPDKELSIIEIYKKNEFRTKPSMIYANQINDGFLRLIAFLAQKETKSSFLLFDEIENGINQELVEFLLKELVEARQQIVVTTHSPLFLNYLNDDLARDSVHYFYKTPEGFTRCKKFFSLPSTSQKLGTLGPGEAIADTNLYRLNEEIERLDCNTGKEG